MAIHPASPAIAAKAAWAVADPHRPPGAPSCQSIQLAQPAAPAVALHTTDEPLEWRARTAPPPTRHCRYASDADADEKKKNETEHLVSFSYNCRVRGQKGFDRGREETQSELSTFRKEEDGKWYFLDGIQGA